MFEHNLISMIIVNYNRTDLTQACIKSILAQSYTNFEIIVVDNASSENSLGLIRNLFPRIKFIANKDNLLYSFAQNQGIIQAKGEFILVLNNDVILENSFLKEAVMAIKSDERIGIVSGKMLSMDKQLIDSAGQFLARSRKPLERGHGQKDQGQFNKEGFIFGACGGCALYRRKMLNEVKLGGNEYFDNDYGLFYEDLDLNWRARLFGWKAYYTPKAICFHARGSSAKSNVPVIRFLRKFNFCYLSCTHQLMLLKNRYSTTIKNDALFKFLLNFPFILSYDFLIWIYLTIFHPSVIVRLFSDISFLKTAYKKRRIIREKRTKSFSHNYYSYPLTIL